MRQRVTTLLGAIGLARSVAPSENRPGRRRAARDDRRDTTGAEHRSGAGAAEGFSRRLLPFDRWQKRHRPAAFVYAVIKKYGEDGGGRLAATVAYYGFFSVFPALLALVSIAGLVLAADSQFRQDLVDTALGQFPVIGGTISDGAFDGNITAVVIGVAGALWAGLGAMLAVSHALDTVWDVPWHERPDPLRGRIRGLLMFLVIGGGLVAATVITNLVTELAMPGIVKFGLVSMNVAVNVLIAFLAFQILTAAHLRWSHLWPGALVAGVLFYGLQTLGSLVVTRYVANAGDTYGAFALVIGLLTWFHIVSQVTLLSAEVNVVRSRRLFPRTLVGDDLTPADRRALAGFQRAAARHKSIEPIDAPAA